MEQKIPGYYMIYSPEAAESKAPEVSEVERLMNEFAAHESRETEFTERYKEITEKSQNPLIKFLLQVIISDEERHHAVAHAMVSTLKRGLDWSGPEGVISGFYKLGAEKETLLKPTKDFIELEKEGIREYKELIRESRGYYHGLFVLLLRGMIRDSEKHVEILEFLLKKLQEA